MWKLIMKRDRKENHITKWVNEKSDGSISTLELWQYNLNNPNSWRLTVNGDWIEQDVSKAKAMSEAKAYMKRVS